MSRRGSGDGSLVVVALVVAGALSALVRAGYMANESAGLLRLVERAVAADNAVATSKARPWEPLAFSSSEEERNEAAPALPAQAPPPDLAEAERMARGWRLAEAALDACRGGR